MKNLYIHRITSSGCYSVEVINDVRVSRDDKGIIAPRHEFQYYKDYGHGYNKSGLNKSIVYMGHFSKTLNSAQYITLDEKINTNKVQELIDSFTKVINGQILERELQISALKQIIETAKGETE